MEGARRRVSVWRITYFRELIQEARNFWLPSRLRLALGIVAAILALEFLFAAAIYAGSPAPLGRAPLGVHRVASLLSLNAGWAKAIFRSSEHLELPMGIFERDLRDPFGVTSNVLHDLAGICLMWLLPVFASLAFANPKQPATPDQSPGRTLLLRSLTTVGPLAFVALVLATATVVVRSILPGLTTSPADPSLYPIERFLRAHWGSIWSNLAVYGPWTLASLVLIPAVAASWRDSQQALAASLGTGLFVLPLLGMALVSVYPGGMDAMPPFLSTYGETLIKLTLFALVLPFALRRLRDETPGD